MSESRTWANVSIGWLVCYRAKDQAEWDRFSRSRGLKDGLLDGEDPRRAFELLGKVDELNDDGSVDILFWTGLHAFRVPEDKVSRFPASIAAGHWRRFTA